MCYADRVISVQKMQNFHKNTVLLRKNENEMKKNHEYFEPTEIFFRSGLIRSIIIAYEFFKFQYNFSIRNLFCEFWKIQIIHWKEKKSQTCNSTQHYFIYLFIEILGTKMKKCSTSKRNWALELTHFEYLYMILHVEKAKFNVDIDFILLIVQ